MARRSSSSKRTVFPAPGCLPKSSAQSLQERTPKWVSSYEQLGEVFGLHRASFPRLIKRLKGMGIAAPRPRANGDHEVEAWRVFLDENPEIKRQAGNVSRALDEEIKEEKLRDLRFDNDVKEGLYLLRSEVEAWLLNKVQQLRDRLTAKLKNELPPKLVGRSAAEIAAKMDREIVSLCRLLQGL